MQDEYIEAQEHPDSWAMPPIEFSQDRQNMGLALGLEGPEDEETINDGGQDYFDTSYFEPTENTGTFQDANSDVGINSIWSTDPQPPMQQQQQQQLVQHQQEATLVHSIQPPAFSQTLLGSDGTTNNPINMTIQPLAAPTGAYLASLPAPQETPNSYAKSKGKQSDVAAASPARRNNSPSSINLSSRTAKSELEPEPLPPVSKKRKTAACVASSLVHGHATTNAPAKTEPYSRQSSVMSVSSPGQLAAALSNANYANHTMYLHAKSAALVESVPLKNSAAAAWTRKKPTPTQANCVPAQPVPTTKKKSPASKNNVASAVHLSQPNLLTNPRLSPVSDAKKPRKRQAVSSNVVNPSHAHMIDPSGLTTSSISGGPSAIPDMNPINDLDREGEMHALLAQLQAIVAAMAPDRRREIHQALLSLASKANSSSGMMGDSLQQQTRTNPNRSTNASSEQQIASVDGSRSGNVLEAVGGRLAGDHATDSRPPASEFLVLRMLFTSDSNLAPAAASSSQQRAPVAAPLLPNSLPSISPVSLHGDVENGGTKGKKPKDMSVAASPMLAGVSSLPKLPAAPPKPKKGKPLAKSP